MFVVKFFVVQLIYYKLRKFPIIEIFLITDIPHIKLGAFILVSILQKGYSIPLTY